MSETFPKILICSKCETISKEYHLDWVYKKDENVYYCPKCYKQQQDQIPKKERELRQKNLKESENEEISKTKFKEEIKDLILRRASRSVITEGLVNYIYHKTKIYTMRQDEALEMWYYKDGVYVSDAQSFIKEVCRDILEAGHTAQLSNEVIAKISAETYIYKNDFFAVTNVNKIAVKNGILNLKEKKLYPFTQNEIYHSKINAEYIPGSKCPEVKKFISEIVEHEEDILTIQEFIGYCLYRENFLEKIFLLEGNGRNGKSKLIELILTLIGHVNKSSVDIHKLQENPFSVSELFGKMINIGGDISKRRLKDTAILKELVGRDPINANRKFKTGLEFVNYAKLLFACNEAPKTMDYSDGFLDRWIILKFPYKFVTQKEIDLETDLEKKKKYKLKNPFRVEQLLTESELNGLLIWALEGLERLHKEDNFTRNPTTNEMRDYWLMKGDSFAYFCRDNVVEDYDSYIEKHKLKKYYIDFCRKNKLTIATEKSIKYFLENEFGVSDEYKTITGTNDRTYVWLGIKIKDEENLTSDIERALNLLTTKYKINEMINTNQIIECLNHGNFTESKAKEVLIRLRTRGDIGSYSDDLYFLV